MKEATFLKQNHAKWKEFERILRDEATAGSADRLANLFVEVTNDLSFARTYFPESNAVLYLNGLAAAIHLEIYKNKKVKGNAFVRFWIQDVPLIMHTHRVKLLWAFVIFALATAIGAISTWQDENFLRVVVGDEYVNYTKENVKHGQPVAIYNQGGETDSFIWIFINNCFFVSFLAFAMGVFCSLGTAVMMLTNGIMFGSFVIFFRQTGYFSDSVLSIMVHGTLEISAIIVTGAAGFILGNSILFPKSFTRLESARRGARDGIKVVLSLIPVFFAAAFLEGYVTRYYEMHLGFKIAIVGLSLLIMAGYYVIYPTIVYRQFNGAKAG